MTLKQIKKLRPGDEVFWNDPDDGRRSRIYKIATIEVRGNEIVVITEPDGSTLECFAHELG